MFSQGSNDPEGLAEVPIISTGPPLLLPFPVPIPLGLTQTCQRLSRTFGVLTQFYLRPFPHLILTMTKDNGLEQAPGLGWHLPQICNATSREHEFSSRRNRACLLLNPYPHVSMAVTLLVLKISGSRFLTQRIVVRRSGSRSGLESLSHVANEVSYDFDRASSPILLAPTGFHNQFQKPMQLAAHIRLSENRAITPTLLQSPSSSASRCAGCRRTRPEGS